MDRMLKILGFTPFLLIVFLNAFVDLGHKILIQNSVFKIYDGQAQIVLTAVVNALILIPFILLFSPAGYLSDRFHKTAIIKKASAAAIGLTLLITLSYYLGWFEAAFAMTFLLAVQSAIYSPAKYSFIKLLAGTENLAKANAFVQATTIVAILLGVFAFSLLFEQQLAGQFYTDPSQLLQTIAPVGWLLVICSIMEWLLAQRLPNLQVPSSELSNSEPNKQQKASDQPSFEWQQYARGEYLQANIKKLVANRSIWLSIVGLSTYWGISQVVLAAFPAFAKETMGLTNTVMIQGMLASSGIGVVIGSLLAGKASKHYIETGLIPVASLGIVMALAALPHLTALWLLTVDFLCLGFFGGLFLVPLNALIQYHAKDEELGTILAGNNWVQNIVMLSFLGLTVLFAVSGVGSKGLFYILTIVAIIGTAYTLYYLPQSFTRYVAGWVFATKYRIDVMGFKNIPAQGGVLLLGNHISWLDWAMVQIACPRPVKFVMLRDIYQRWYLKWFLDFFGVIPISGGNSRESLAQINERLQAGQVVCLFPEGAISRNGQLGEFKTGYERTVEGVDGKIVPFYLRGLWGSQFSLSTGDIRESRKSGLRRDVIVAFGKPLPMTIKPPELKRKVFDLSISAWDQHTQTLDTLPLAWMRTAKQHGGKLCMVDGKDGSPLNGYKAMTGAITLSRQIKTQSSEQNIGLLLPASCGGILANMAVLLAGKTVVNLNFTASIPALKSAIAKGEIHSIYTSRRFINKLSKRGFEFETLTNGTDRGKTLAVFYLEDMVTQIHKLTQLTWMMATIVLPASLLNWLCGNRAQLQDPAAILFSSGSEGEPKGVVLSHQNIMSNIRQVSDVLDTQASDTIMATLPLFHAFGLTVTGLMPMIEGVPVVFHPDPTDTLVIAKAIAKYDATVFCGTSTFLRLFTRNDRIHPLMLDSLRIIVSGAERLNPEVRDAFKLKFNRSIYEGYGTTETTPVASVNIPDRIDPRSWKVQEGTRHGTVGLPLPGGSFQIVDPETLQPLPTGEDGLILFGGTQIMLGYLNDPDKTGDVIVELDNQRWYKTGDKGHLDKDGFLTIVDRYSRFAKIGGEMISLGAIETELGKVLPAEMEVLTTAIPDGKKGEKVVLLVASEMNDDELTTMINKAELNPLMKPSAVVPVEAIPKLGSGKNDFSQAKKIALEACH